MLDDTCYFLPCSSAQEAAVLTALCNDPITLAFLGSASFKSAKRPVTKALLQRIDLGRSCRGPIGQLSRRVLAKFKNASLDSTRGRRSRRTIAKMEHQFGRQKSSITSDSLVGSPGGNPLMKLRHIAYAIYFVGTITCAAWGGGPEEAQAGPKVKLKTRNILLVTTDGLRWQEVFGGVDLALMNKENGGVADPSLLKRDFGGETPRCAGSVSCRFSGPRSRSRGRSSATSAAGSEVRVTNGKNFSYPGYNEILTGSADPKIDSNDKVPNQNVTVLEWLNGQDDFRNRVAAFGSWDVFPYIINRWRSRVRVVAGWQPMVGMGLSKEEVLISRLVAETPRMWENCCYDSFTYHAALEYFKRQRPRVLYLALGETDEFAHEGRYEHYLRAAQQRRPAPEVPVGNRSSHARLPRRNHDDRDHRPRPRERPGRMEEPRR